MNPDNPCCALQRCTTVKIKRLFKIVLLDQLTADKYELNQNTFRDRYSFRAKNNMCVLVEPAKISRYK